MNDAPVNGVPGAQGVNEDTSLVFSGANAITISDVDVGAGNETVTLSVASGALTLSGTAGLAFTVGDGTADSTMTFSGTVAAINAALNGLGYQGNLNFNGSDTLNITTNDNGNTGIGGAQSDADSVAIGVAAVNDAPTLTAHDRDPVYAAGVQLFDSASVSVGPADESAQNIKQLVLTVSNVDGTGTTDHMSIDGTDVFLTNGNTALGANHGVSISVALAGGTATVTISKPVGDIPAADVASIVNGLTYTNDDVTGGETARNVTIASIQDSGGIAPGVDTSTPNIVSTVNFNLPPAIDSDGSGATAAKSVAENATTVTTVHATDPDNGPVTPVTYSIVPGDDGAKFGIDAGGNLVFLAAPDFENPTDVGDTAGNNTYVVTVRASDGVSFDDQTITVTVTDVNEAPVITSDGAGATASINVNENSTTVTTVTSTDQDTPAQTLTYSLVVGAGSPDQAKFTIDAAGHLSFITAPNFEIPTDANADNDYVVQVKVTDNGVNPANLSDIQTITVHVQNVNEAPDTAAVTANGAEDPTGPAYIPITFTGSDVDSGDTIASFHITNIPNAGTQGTLYSDIGLTTVVAEGANVTASGGSVTLYFKPNADFNTHAGAVTFNAAATDNHGLTDATPATETINISAVDDAPINLGVPANFVVQSGFTHVITGLSISDVDANEVGTPTNISTTLASSAGGIVTIGNGATGTNAGISGGAIVSTNASGSVVLTGSVDQINASLSASNGVVYKAADNAGNTTATLTMTTNDAGHNGTGGPLTDVDVIQVGVIPQVWFIDSTPTSVDATAPLGSQANPFASVHDFNVASGPGINDYIYVKEGTYDGEGINLKAGQTLLGDDQALSFTNPLPGGGTIVIEDATGNRPVISVNAANSTDQGIALASNNTVAGINVVTNAAGQTGIDDSGATVGTLNISAADVTGSGQAINLTHGGTGGTVSLGTVSSSGGAAGIALGGALATNFSATGGTLSGHTGSEFSVNGGTGTVSYGGNIADGSGLTSVSIVNHATGGVTLSGTITDGADANGGIGISGNTNTSINFTGSSKALNTGIGDGVSITNNSGSTVTFSNGGLAIQTTNGTAFQDTVAGTLEVSGAGNTISTNGNGAALNLSSIVVGGNGINFSSTTSTNSTGTAVAISGATGGAIALGSGSISGSDGDAFRVGDGAGGANTGGTSAITYSGTISKTDGTGQAVDIQDRAAGAGNITLSGNITHNLAANTGILLDDNAAGTITFSGGSKAITSTTATAVNLTDNAGATIAFTGGGLAITSTTGAGFNATGGGPAATTGGTVTVTGTGNTITSSGGAALNVVHTTIGAAELTFQSIAANGGVNGIVLNNTGTTGGLNVTGGGAAARDGTGGTITGTSGDGVSLTNTSQVSLTHMNINSTGGQGVMGSAVNGFVSDWNSFSANGNATKEGAIRFGFETDPNATGLTGGAIGSATETRIDNTLISGSFERGVSIFNNSGTLTQLNVHGTTIQNSTNGSGMLLELRGNAVALTDLQNSVFTGNKAAGFQGVGTAQSNLTVNAIGAGGHSNTFSNNNDGVLIGSTNDADVTTEFSNNTFSGNTPGVAITVSTFQSSTASGSLSAKILNNTVSVPATGLNDAIQALMSGTGTPQHIKIDGNVITDAGTGANGIFVGTPDAGTSPNFTAIITNNTVTMTDTVNSGNGISAQSTKGGSAVFKIEGNTVSGAAIDGIFLFRPNTSTSTVSLERGISPSNTASVVLAANNPNAHSAAGGLDTEVLGTITVVNNGTITLPLNAALGGVAAATPEQAASTGNYHLTQLALDTVVAAAISQWAAAGASASQLAAMHATTFSVEDLAGKTIGDESTGHIAIDVDAAGHGWFVDPTPNDNSEFTHAANAAGTDLYTDATNAAAGHLDLLTTVSHELGHVIGLDDTTNPGDAHDLMFINLVDGERRLPDGADLAQVNADASSRSPADLAGAGRNADRCGQRRQQHHRCRQRRQHPVRRRRRGQLCVRREHPAQCRDARADHPRRRLQRGAGRYFRLLSADLGVPQLKRERFSGRARGGGCQRQVRDAAGRSYRPDGDAVCTELGQCRATRRRARRRRREYFDRQQSFRAPRTDSCRLVGVVRHNASH